MLRTCTGGVGMTLSATSEFDCGKSMYRGSIPFGVGLGLAAISMKLAPGVLNGLSPTRDAFTPRG